MRADRHLQVPYDTEAETTVVGCAVSLHSAYVRATGLLRPTDFYKPAHQRLFEACALMAELDGTHPDTEAHRADMASRVAEVPVDEVWRLIDERLVTHDRAGTYAQRVKTAALGRRLMQVTGDAFDRLGSGEPADAVVVDLAACVESLFRAAA